jgi:hypothetical protein
MPADVGGMGNDRWLARLEYKTFRKTWVYYATHTNAGVQHVAQGPQFGKLLKTPNGNARWEVYKKQMAMIEQHMAIDIDDPDIDVVTIGGDLNMLPEADGVTEHYSPHQTFKRLGMTYVNTRVVYLASHGAEIHKSQVFPAGQHGWESDHAALKGWIS